jgi:hypothetical protein
VISVINSIHKRIPNLPIEGHQLNEKMTRALLSDGFTHNIMRMLILGTARAYGFEKISECSLHFITDCIIQDVTNLGIIAQRFAYRGGRTDVNRFRAFYALARSSRRENPSTLAAFIQSESRFPPRDTSHVYPGGKRFSPEL